MIRLITSHELRVFARSPFAWVAAAVLQLIFGWLLLSATEQYTLLQDAQGHLPSSGISGYLVVHFLAPASVVMMLITPLLCMNLVAGDRQAGRYVLFSSAPVDARDIVLGKYFAAIAFQLAIISISALLMSFLATGTQLDVLHLATAYLGLALFVVLASAVSILFSSLTTMPALAALLSLATLILLWMVASAGTDGLIGWISPSVHLNSFMQGLLDSRDVLYFVCMSAIAITFSIWHLDNINRFKETSQ